MSEDQKQTRLNEGMQQAVQSVLSDVYPGDLLTRFVVVCESLDGDDSERALIVATTPSMKAWDALGMLTFALQREQAAAVADEMGDG